jgi:hypothetical protein
MDCLCGKPMNILGRIITHPYEPTIEVYVCSPDGCGRLYLESPGLEVAGTYYLAETNYKQELL